MIKKTAKKRKSVKKTVAKKTAVKKTAVKKIAAKKPAVKKPAAKKTAAKKTAAGADSGTPRIIKKYPNRRLYDTQTSRHITLEELKEWIVSGEDFRVFSADGEDITRQTLISILVSAEVMGQPLFSEQSLRNMVMFMQGPMRGPMRIFFEQCLPLFAHGNQQLMSKFGPLAGSRELENIALLQGGMVRQLMEQYVFRALENYLSAQKNMEKIMSLQAPFPFQTMLDVPPPPEDK